MDATPPPAPPARDTLLLAEFLPYRLSILAESVSRAFARHYETRFGITIPEWRVMAVLGEGAGSTQQVIARTRMDRVKVSRAVNRLDAKGLVHRTLLPDDARARRIRLSPAGTALYRQIVPLARQLQAELVQAMSEAELAVLDAAIRRLLERSELLGPAA